MKPNFFGLNINGHGQPILAKMDSYRSWDNGCRWGILNPARGVYNFAPMAAWMGVLEILGVTDIIFELGATPQWASSEPNGSRCNYGNGCCAPPVDLKPDGTGVNQIWADWCEAVKKFFAAYPAVTVHYSIWNEFVREGDYEGTLAWTGTNQQLVRLARDAKTILSGGKGKMLAPNTGTGSYFNEKFNAYLKTPGATEACDVIVTHVYQATAKQIAEEVAQFKESLDPVNRAKPLWVGEFSFGQNTQHQEEVSFVNDCVRYLEPIVDRIYWYSYAWQNAPLYANGVLTPTGVAWNKAYEAAKEQTI